MHNRSLCHMLARRQTMIIMTSGAGPECVEAQMDTNQRLTGPCMHRFSGGVSEANVELRKVWLSNKLRSHILCSATTRPIRTIGDVNTDPLWRIGSHACTPNFFLP
jgi:hypothetical protein